MKEFIQNLEDMLDLPAGELQADTRLADITGWDSMAAVGFLAMADGKYGKAVSPAAIKTSKTVSDLAALVGQS
ncbi:MAG: acyl carrier protein [Verrucomicrobiota bacterium]